MEARETKPERRRTTSQTAKAASAGTGAIPTKTPMAVRTPLPPRNPANTVKV